MRFFAVDITLHAVHFCGTVQVAIFAAGRNSGYSITADSHVTPDRHPLNLTLTTCRSVTRRLDDCTAARYNAREFSSPPSAGI